MPDIRIRVPRSLELIRFAASEYSVRALSSATDVTTFAALTGENSDETFVGVFAAEGSGYRMQLLRITECGESIEVLAEKEIDLTSPGARSGRPRGTARTNWNARTA